MKQNEINAYLAAKGLGNLTGAELANAQATARLDLLLERAGDSIGAFTRASDTLYGSQQRLNAIMGNLQVAFGSAFQEPLAAVNNALANVAQDGGGQLIDIGEEMGATIDALAPIVETLGKVLVGLLAPLEQIIALGGAVAGTFVSIFKPLLDIVGGGLDQVNGVLDGISLGFKQIAEAQEVKPGQTSFIDNLLGPEWNKVGTELMRIDAELDKAWLKQQARVRLGEAMLKEGIQDTETRREAALVGRLAEQMEKAAALAERAKASASRFGDVLYSLGIQSVDAEGDLAGLTKVFGEIDEAAAQSKASEALDEIGFSAGQIEAILTRPDWAALFGDIARLAKIAAIDIDLSMKGLSLSAVVGLSNARLALEKAMSGILDTGGSGSSSTAAKEEAKDYVKEFLDGIQEEVMKQTARLQLQNMTGSEGLIEAILGAENWLQIWTKIKAGLIPLEDLEKQFYKTAEGAQELADTAKAWEEYEDQIAALELQLLDTIDAINAAADALKLSFSDMFSAFDVLPTIAVEMGRFESAIVSQLASIESSLQSAFRNGDLFEEGYNTLRNFARQELSVLQSMQRQRDDMASRFSLSKAIIDEYRTAFTGAMQLTSLFNSLKDETEKRTVTEVTKGVVKLGKSLREFNIVVTRDYEETITNVTLEPLRTWGLTGNYSISL